MGGISSSLKGGSQVELHLMVDNSTMMGTTEIDRIEEEVQLKYQLPDDFMMG